MKIILDTHVFLWTLSEPDKLSKEKRAEVESLANTIYVSSVSIAEIMIKASIGKLTVPFDPVEEAEKCGFEPLPLSGSEALLLRDLPLHHRDPFDRLLIAQSMANSFSLMTDDDKFRRYDCAVL